MSNASNYLEEQIGTHLLRSLDWPKPQALYVALFTTMPAEDGSGAVEVSGGGYVRVQHGPGNDKWSAPASGNGLFSNLGTILFPSPSADWGTVVGFGIYDDATAGNYLLGGILAVQRTITGGDPSPNFPEGALKLTVS